jgi:hypothetical protein
VDLEAEATTAYETAVERVQMIAKEWDELGNPLTTRGSTGQTVPHPMIKMLQDAEVLADRLRKSVRKAHRGPAPSAVIKPPKSANLRAVQ